jgi:hypothetical protein
MARLGRDELDGKTESHQAIPEGQVSRAMETGSLIHYCRFDAAKLLRCLHFPISKN